VVEPDDVNPNQARGDPGDCRVNGDRLSAARRLRVVLIERLGSEGEKAEESNTPHA
jgi:hypothetical protein